MLSQNFGINLTNNSVPNILLFDFSIGVFTFDTTAITFDATDRTWDET